MMRIFSVWRLKRKDSYIKKHLKLYCFLLSVTITFTSFSNVVASDTLVSNDDTYGTSGKICYTSLEPEFMHKDKNQQDRISIIS